MLVLVSVALSFWYSFTCLPRSVRAGKAQAEGSSCARVVLRSSKLSTSDLCSVFHRAATDWHIINKTFQQSFWQPGRHHQPETNEKSQRLPEQSGEVTASGLQKYNGRQRFSKSI